MYELQNKTGTLQRMGHRWILPWCCTKHPETPGSNLWSQSPAKQTKAKCPNRYKKPETASRSEPPTAPMRDQPVFSTEMLVQISHEGSCIKRNHLTLSYIHVWYRSPVLASGFLSLGSQSMEESLHLLLPSREMTLLPAKSNFSSLPQTLFWVSTHWNVKFELFWLDTEVPRGCLVFWWSAIIEGKKHPWCEHSRLWMQNSSSVEIPWLLEMCSSHRLCCQ